MNPADDIVVSPDPRLREKCADIEVIDDEIAELAFRMLDEMYAAEGVGLAAPQVGVLKRIVVIDVDYPEGEPNPYVLINPQIIEASEETVPFDEGCLSFPGISVTIERPRRVVVQAENLDGDLMQYEAADNLFAVCLQHEIDHLNGVTMVDHLTPAERIGVLRQYEEALAAGARPGETSVR